MSNHLYYRLAVNNIRKNSKVYFPYILACIGTIMMFYNMKFLSSAKNIGFEHGSLRQMLAFGVAVIGIFSVIFLFYTNSFLIKRRKKEFGLYNILGMEKKHISKLIFIETLLVGVISLVFGILAGILTSKLMGLLLLKLITFKVNFAFEVPKSALYSTIIMYGIIFIVNFIYNILQVHLSHPIDLLRGGNVGEREPKTKWILTIIGIITLGTGYYIAVTTESPLAALNLFFFAVILVIIGTYCLFTAGSITFLKMLRKNKKYYYHPKHFYSVSSMIHRMKQNAAGLSNICILSTMVIVTLSTTLSLYIGVDDILHERYPKDISIETKNISNAEIEDIINSVDSETSKAGILQENVINYRYLVIPTIQEDSSFVYATSDFYSSGFSMVLFMTQSDYNSIAKKDIKLSENETIVYEMRGEIAGDYIDFNGLKLKVKDKLDNLDVDGGITAVIGNCYYFIVKDVKTIEIISESLNANPKMNSITYYYGFDVNAKREEQITLTSSIRKAIKEKGIKVEVEGRESSRADFYSLYGGLFFLGLFLGLLFIMATVLIIYYKQVAEGYEDKNRFNIMQKVGMSHDEIKKSIKSQVLSVFFLPLLVAVIHIAFAFKVITRLLILFNLTNIMLYAICTAITIIVFGIFYAAVYGITAKTYYKIIS